MRWMGWLLPGKRNMRNCNTMLNKEQKDERSDATKMLREPKLVT
jgi:hypothetical protein